MASLHKSLLRHAKASIEGIGPGRPPADDEQTLHRQVALRRSISTSYYAAWHSVCATVAAKFDARLQPQLCRTPDHIRVKSAAAELKSGKNDWLGCGCSPRMRKFCLDFIQLQEQRHAADYDVAREFRKADATIAIKRAERIQATLEWARQDSPCELDAFVLGCLKLSAPKRS